MISINIDKAKVIGHDIRRKQRDEEFAPHDAIIAKQIPGVDAQAAEAARLEIRSKYAAIQTQINSATTPDEIKSALGI